MGRAPVPNKNTKSYSSARAASPKNAYTCTSDRNGRASKECHDSKRNVGGGLSLVGGGLRLVGGGLRLVGGGLRLPVLSALVAVLVSFSLGVLTPPLLSLVMVIDADTIRTSRYVVERLKLLPSSWGVSVQLKAQLHGRGGCFLENLADFLHEDPVPGLHVICVRGGDDDGISVTMYPGSQTNTSLVRKTRNNWSSFRSLVTEELNLRFYNAFTKDTTEKWTIYTPNGDKVVSIQDLTNDDANYGSDHNHHILQTIVQQGMVLIYQGGAFVWPGVRIGFERYVKLQVPLTINNSITTADDTRQHYYYVTLKTLSLNPLVLSVQNFLTNSECHHIQTQAIPRMQYSDVSLMDQDKGKAASQFRTSQSTFLPSREDLKLQYIDHRVASLTRLPPDHQEMVQVLRYGLAEKYDAHNDYFDPFLYQSSPDVLRSIRNGERNRHATVFWYLTTVKEGGETYFPRAGKLPHPQNLTGCHDNGLQVKPEKGKVIIFYDMLPTGEVDPYSLHAACPVKHGIKWAANKWVWNAPSQFAEVF